MMNHRKVVLWCSAVLGATGTLFWVLGISLEGVINVDDHPVRLLAAVGAGVSIAAACLARLVPHVFFISPAVPWSKVATHMLIGAIASYPVMAVCYAAGATAFIAARGSLGERDAGLAIILVALWLPLWTLPLSAAVFAWWRSVHIRPASGREAR